MRLRSYWDRLEKGSKHFSLIVYSTLKTISTFVFRIRISKTILVCLWMERRKENKKTRTCRRYLRMGIFVSFYCFFFRLFYLSIVLHESCTSVCIWIRFLYIYLLIYISVCFSIHLYSYTMITLNPPKLYIYSKRREITTRTVYWILLFNLSPHIFTAKKELLKNMWLI